MDQTEITERVKFGVVHVPPYPIMWSYCAMSPVIDSQQLESIKQFNIVDKDVLRQIKKLVKPLVQDSYDIEYFMVKQKVFKEIETASMSFHTWYYSKVSNGSTDMSDAEFQGKIIIGAVSVNDFIAEPTKKSFGGKKSNKLVLNGLGERAVLLRRQLKSPKNENSFRITCDTLFDIKFVTVAYITELKKAVVTLHILHLF
jgi:hypothetical protein